MSVAIRAGGDRTSRHALRVRTQQLPLGSRTAVAAFERFLRAAEVGAPEAALAHLGALVTRLGAAYAAGGSLTDVVGDDPVAFAERLVGPGVWSARLDVERAQLADTFARARREEGDL